MVALWFTNCAKLNWKNDAYVSHLWLMNVASGASFQLTRGKKSADQAEWSPDGHWLAFVTERESTAIEPLALEKEREKEREKDKEEKRKEEGKETGHGDEKPAQHQIWVISPQGGEAWQLTKSETDVAHFHWSKDSQWIMPVHGESTGNQSLRRIARKSTPSMRYTRRTTISTSCGW